jgi:hypothetical protein
MKRLAILVIAFIIITIKDYAQQSAARYGENYSLYYSPVMIGPNGFRTVEEENRLMTETLVAIKRQREKDEGTEAEIAREKKKNDEEVTAKKSLFDAKKNDSVKVKK